MAETYDVAIVGLGAMGSAAAWHLAARGLAVLGLDRFDPPHAQGSSHGDSRIIREAYFEHPAYVPLVQRAYTLWHDVERRTGIALHRRTGGLMLGTAHSDLVAGALRSAREHGLVHEVLPASAVRARFPALAVPEDMVAVLEPRAGILFPERCIAAHLALARAAGADLHPNEAVRAWGVHGHTVHIDAAGARYAAKHLVLAAGAWTTALLPDLALPLSVERQVLYWFDVAGDPRFAPAACPVHLWQFDGRQFFYGFPDLGDGVKLARHHHGAMTTADQVERDVGQEEIDDIRRLVQRFVPHAAGVLRRTAVCLYTNTPDEHFWIDRHPRHREVLIVSACSGHGFKFSSALGEAIADLVLEQAPRFDLALFRARPLP